MPSFNRRLDAWLPHGLAEGLTAEDLAPHITLCRVTQPFSPGSSCQPEPFTLRLVSKSILRMDVSQLAASSKYQVNHLNGASHTYIGTERLISLYRGLNFFVCGVVLSIKYLIYLLFLG